MSNTGPRLRLYEGEMEDVVLLLESILGERSRTIARIKRENFHRGVSCVEPLAGVQAQQRVVSWDQTVRERPQSSLETRQETDKLREMISIRRGSTQTDQKVKEETERGRPELRRGSSQQTQHVLKTSERPPLSRGFSCQQGPVSSRKNFPTITLTRPHSASVAPPKIDLLSAVSEIHENLKDGRRSPVNLTEEETEDEFHEELQGGPRSLVPAPDKEMRSVTNLSSN